MPLDGPARPYPKESSLVRGQRRSSRQRAGTKRWAQIAESKQGPCRTCNAAGPSQLHHIIRRSQGGADTESNVVPLCPICHMAIEAHDAAVSRALVESLTDAEYSFAIHHGGEGFFERAYGLRYTRA